MVPETNPHPNVYFMMLLIKTEVTIPFINISSPRIGERLSEDSQQPVFTLFKSSFMQSVGEGYLGVSRETEVNQDSVRMTCKQRSDVINFAPKRLDDEEGFEVNMHYKQFPTSTILKFNSDVKFYNYHNANWRSNITDTTAEHIS